MTARLTTCLLAALCLSAGARPTQATTPPDIIQRDAVAAVRGTRQEAYTVELRGRLATSLARRGDTTLAVALLSELRPVNPHDDPQQAEDIKGAWRATRRAVITHQLLSATCALWSSPARCAAASKVDALLAAHEALQRPAWDLHALWMLVERCERRHDLSCAMQLINSHTYPWLHISLLLRARDYFGPSHPALTTAKLLPVIHRIIRSEPDKVSLIDELMKIVVKEGDEEITKFNSELQSLSRHSNLKTQKLIEERIKKYAIKIKQLDRCTEGDKLLKTTKHKDDNTIYLKCDPLKISLEKILSKEHQFTYLIDLAHIAAQQDIAIARRAIAAAHELKANQPHSEIRAYTWVAAHAHNTGQPYEDLLHTVREISPPGTRGYAEHQVMFAMWTAQTQGAAARLRAAAKLIDPTWPFDRITVNLAMLIAAHKQRGEEETANRLFQRLLASIPMLRFSSVPNKRDPGAMYKTMRALVEVGAYAEALHVSTLPINEWDQHIILGAFIDTAREREDRSPALQAFLLQHITSQPDAQRRANTLNNFAELLDPALLDELIDSLIIAEPLVDIPIYGKVSEILIIKSHKFNLLDRIKSRRPDHQADHYMHILELLPPRHPLAEGALERVGALELPQLYSSSKAKHRNALVVAYAERGRCDEALALAADGRFIHIDHALALLIVPCARAGKLDAAHQLALRLPTPVRRAEALVWLVEVAPLIAATRGAP